MQLAAFALTVPLHNTPCVDEVNVTVPVGAVLFTTVEGVTVADKRSVAPLATEVEAALTVVVVLVVPVLAAGVVTVDDVLVA